MVRCLQQKYTYIYKQCSQQIYKKKLIVRVNSLFLEQYFKSLKLSLWFRLCPSNLDLADVFSSNLYGLCQFDHVVSNLVVSY